MDDFDKANIERAFARITAIEYVLEHVFAWMLIEGGADGEAVLDDLVKRRPSRTAPGTLMDASAYQRLDEAVQTELEDLARKLRARYREIDALSRKG